MAERGSRYQLTRLEPEYFIVLLGLDFAIAKNMATKVYLRGERVLTDISWYEAKILVQSLGADFFLPTSAQWGKARENKDTAASIYESAPYAGRRLSPDELYLASFFEWVDSLLAFPYNEGEYSRKLRILGIKKGEAPLLIEKSKVERSGDDYVITEGKVTEIPQSLVPLKARFPQTGYIQGWDEDLGLPTEVGEYPNQMRFRRAEFRIDTYIPPYDEAEGLRALARGYWSTVGIGTSFETIAINPSKLGAGLPCSFRLGRTLTEEERARARRAIDRR